MFPRRMSLLEVGMTLEDVALLGGCCPPDRDSSLNLLFMVFVSGAVSVSHVDVAFNVLYLNSVTIYWCVVFASSRLSSNCLSSHPGFYFHQLVRY